MFYDSCENVSWYKHSGLLTIQKEFLNSLLYSKNWEKKFENKIEKCINEEKRT